ncbi:MAG: cation transporter [Gammaproteobacteria bacterium]|nr:cation transporter [Gammaproteobacteria bacterium]
MSCASCVSAVESALLQSPGVASASVNYADQSAWVTGSPDVSDLIDAVESAGYSASVRDEDDEARDRNMRRAFLVAVRRSAVALSIGAVMMGGMMLSVLPWPGPTPLLGRGRTRRRRGDGMERRSLLSGCDNRGAPRLHDDGYSDCARHRCRLAVLHAGGCRSRPDSS